MPRIILIVLIAASMSGCAVFHHRSEHTETTLVRFGIDTKLGALDAIQEADGSVAIEIDALASQSQAINALANIAQGAK